MLLRADLFHYLNETELLKKLVKSNEKIRSLLSFHYFTFGEHVNVICSSQLEIKDMTYSSSSAFN